MPEIITSDYLCLMCEWFETWFDSEYYHLLYKDRDYTEAEAFVEKLVDYLQPNTDTFFHDLACGKGRHSIHLNKLGLNVEGSDYSANSIQHAKHFENKRLHFYEHDMRNEMPRQYDCIVNLFTSFGYFDTDKEHLNTLRNCYRGLNDGGTFVFDFMNVSYVVEHLVPEETTQKEHISFEIRRRLINGMITKDISFEDKGKSYQFKEEVAALTPDKLTHMMKDCGFQIQDTFGSYALEPFDLKTSKRLILILRK
ncbi:MAG: SAM-dependent methyltransferase [Bacteroidetes bacterium]|nr:MAG: SAM-dependent methyltransferase [Bacteroidota bacterium]